MIMMLLCSPTPGQLWSTRAFSAECAQYAEIVTHWPVNTGGREDVKTVRKHVRRQTSDGLCSRKQERKKVLKIDGAFAPRVLRFDSGCAAEGCGIA